MNGAGAVRIRVRRAFVAAGGQPVTMRELVRWIWPRREVFRSWHYERARKAAGEVAERVRLERRGRSFVVVWRALGPIEPARPMRRQTGRLWHGWPLPADTSSEGDTRTNIDKSVY